ncbi:tetratricopeptide repeat protein [Gymnodinialimonas sp. 2305UL16-5]|uniref:tetratricopeptide repeat protein n=1 Tax=Gymnodinialimonas mytili TaxID=3126503 RepID=UPI0030B0BFD8
MFRAVILASSAALALTATPLAAQTSTTEAQRQAVFQQMLSDPANRDLMIQYAQMSVSLRDFEAAAATLERLVDLEPDNTAARVELAIAYFALGSYDVAEYHLTAAQRGGGLTPEQSARVSRYLDAAEVGTRDNAISGRVALGFAVTEDTDEEGIFLNVGVDWRLDLGDANVTQLVTEFGFTSYSPGQNTGNNRTQGRLRVGPEFRLGGSAYSARLQPYVQGEVFTSSVDSAGFQSFEAGLAYQNPLSQHVTIYSDLSFGMAYGTDAGAEDFSFAQAELGATYRPSRDTRLRASLRVEEQETDEVNPETTELQGLRISAQHAFDQSLIDVPNRWVVGAFGDFETAEASSAFSMSETDTDYYGLWMRAFMFEDTFVEISAAQVIQDVTQSGTTTTTEENIYTVQIGWEF